MLTLTMFRDCKIYNVVKKCYCKFVTDAKKRQFK